jgi:hypothetical protein
MAVFEPDTRDILAQANDLARKTDGGALGRPDEVALTRTSG